MDDARLAELLERAGFPATERGPYVTAYRAVIARKMKAGLTYHSPGTWARNDISAEDRARELLAINWSVERGHVCQIECIDGITGWQFTRTGNGIRRFIRWKHAPAWARDQARRALMKFRIWRDRMMGIENPWRAKITQGSEKGS